MPSRRPILAVIGVAGVLAALSPLVTHAGAATSVAPRFTAPLELKGYGGGEPSLAIDHGHPNYVYVTAPQGFPTAAGVVFNSPTSGVGFWASSNGGKTFTISHDIGSAAGGGDSDVEVGTDGTVYVADLEAAGAAICTSTNHGATFTSGNAAGSADKCQNATTNQQGPENDRQWLTADRSQAGDLYLTYHDFAGGYPIIERSTDHGATFAPCGAILDPTSQAGLQYSPSNGTLVAKPTIDRSGRMFVEVTEPPLNSPPVGASLNSLFIAVANQGCTPGTVFKNYTIYTNPGANLGKIFNMVSVDGGGNVYVVAGGQTAAGQTNTNVWLFVSHNHGVSWTPPIRVNTPDLKANVMPAVVGGLGNNEVAIGWFGTSTNPDPNYQKSKWRYYVSTSFDGGKHFNQTTVTPNYIHYGDICTQGLFCGLIPGQPSNRNLADFDSLAINPLSGQLIVAFPGDPYNRPDINGNNNFGSSAYVVRQVGGRPLH